MQKLYVISGGPGTGKTTTINELEKRGFKILKEAAREVSKKDKRFIGKSVLEINKKDFQDAIFNFQIKQIKNLEEQIKNNKLKNQNLKIFSDRGFGDTLAYYKIYNLKIPKEKMKEIKKIIYEKIFILDFLDFYEQDELRKESKKEQEKIHKNIINMYKKLGYKDKIIIVPSMSVDERVNFILDKI